MATKYLTLNMQELHVDIPQKADTTQVSIVSEHNTYVDIVEEECAMFALVSSPDPTLSRGETVWWTKSNFLGLAHAFATL